MVKVVSSETRFEAATVSRQPVSLKTFAHPGAAHVFRKSFDTSELLAALQKFCGFEREATAEMSG